MYICIGILAVNSCVFIGLTLFYYLRFRNLKTKFINEPTYDCQQLLAEILSGTAVVKIERIPTENIFLRRR